MKTLAGIRVLITRGRTRSARFRQLLESQGAEIHEIPAIAFLPIPNQGLRDALNRSEAYDWTLFTSSTAVGRVRDLSRQLGCWPLRNRLAAVGPATATAIREAGLKVDLVAERHQAEGLLEAFDGLYPAGLSGLSFLFPIAARARPVLGAGLRDRGGLVDEFVCYDTVPDETSREPLIRLLDESPPDLVTITSPSCLHALLTLAGPDRIASLRFAAIGPTTAAAAADLDLDVPIVSGRSTIPDLVGSIEEFFVARKD